MADGTKNEGLTSPELRDELRASLRARGELGEDMEGEVVESFLGRIQGAIDEQVEAGVAERLKGLKGRRSGVSTGRVAVVLVFSVPLMGIAGALGGQYGVLAVVALALALVFAR